MNMKLLAERPFNNIPSPVDSNYQMGDLKFSPAKLILLGIYEEESFSSKSLTVFDKQEFSWAGVEYTLKTPVLCTSELQNGVWIVECSKYNLVASDKNKNEALRQLAEQFVALYRGLTEENNKNLTKDAIELKEKLKKEIANIKGN